MNDHPSVLKSLNFADPIVENVLQFLRLPPQKIPQPRCLECYATCFGLCRITTNYERWPDRYAEESLGYSLVYGIEHRGKWDMTICDSCRGWIVKTPNSAEVNLTARHYAWEEGELDRVSNNCFGPEVK